MPRVNLVKKARKAQGNCGKCGDPINIGDAYKYWEFRFGGRYVRCLKPACAPKPSDLTQSEFKGTLYGIQEAVESAIKDFRNGGDKDSLVEALREQKDAMEELGQECRGKYDNMPEGLQQGDTGQLLEARADSCEEKANEIDSAADEVESIDLHEDWTTFAQEESLDREEDETDEAYEERVTAKMEEENEQLRADNAPDLDLDIE